MENFQEKIREIIYQESFILYKKCLKVTIDKSRNIKILFDSDMGNRLIDEKFLLNLNNKILKLLNIKNNDDIHKIIKFHFNNTRIKNIEGVYKLSKSKDKNIDELVNPIKLQILRKFYKYIELDKLENNIFNFLNFNTFIYYHRKYFKTYLTNLGYLILFIYIYYLIDL